MTREQIDALAERIADLSLRIDVAQHALLTHLREFDMHDGWGNSGYPSAAAWLAWRIDIGIVAAREHVRVARALGELKLVDAAFAAGKLTYSKVRAITRVATAQTEQGLLDIAMHATASQVEKIAAAYRRTRVDPAVPAMDVRRFARRTQTRSGMVRLEIQLPPEQANLVWEALTAALEAGRRDSGSAESGGSARGDAAAGAGDDSANSREDAGVESGVESGGSASVSAFAESGDAAAGTGDASGESGDGGATRPADASAHSQHEARHQLELDPSVLQAECADALVSVAQAYLQHSPRTLGSGYELVLMTTQDQLEHGPGGVGGFLRDGTPVPLHIARMLACDCSRVDVEAGESGEILDVGRARRTVPTAIHRALWLRDGGCRVPGCGRKHHVHAHHIEGWAKGGKTSLANLVLLCPSHHMLVHEGQLRVAVCEGKIEFRNGYGLEIRPAPGRGDDLESVAQWLGSEVAFQRFPQWDGSRLDLGAAVDWMFTAQS